MIVLGARTDFSFLRGYGTAKQWLARCEEIGIEALAITDYCSTWGHVAFWEAFKGKKTKLIYGVQLPVVRVLEKDPAHDLVALLAKNQDGLQAIYGAMRTAQDQMYYRPRLTWEQVKELAENCHVIVHEISFSNLDVAEKVPGITISAQPVRSRLGAIVRSGDFPVLASPVPTFPRVEDRDAYALMRAIGQGQQIGELEPNAYPLMRRGDYEAALKACGIETKKPWFKLAERIAADCNVEFPQATKIKIAHDQDDAQRELMQLCRKGAKKLNVNLKDEAYAQRLTRELSVIREKRFEDYFLFVSDLCSWARDRMFVGPARGSSGGSLLCFLLGITTIDPLKYGTLFERFIDITRNDWPDIDIDFPDNRRAEVYDYLKGKYGEDHVARLGTISELGGKSAINDTAKATGVKYEVARELGKIVETYIVSGIARKDLKEIFTEDKQAASIVALHEPLRLAEKIEDHARHHGVHAAGVVVTNEPSIRFGAVDKHGTIALDMKMAEKIGLIKMDALGLRTLAVIQDCCDQLKINPDTLFGLDFLGGDAKVWELFNKDRVTGIFQFEGHAVRQLMKTIKVEKFDDIAALTSLARPGPLMGGAAGVWCERRSGEIDWDYKHPTLAPHTASTFGVICYQEQAMGIVRDLGAFDEPAVNGFRRAIGKKLPEQLRSYREQFLAGCKAKPVPEEIAAELWDEMCEFGSYAFNLAHAVAYGMISYMAAHLKAYHPLEFAVANLRNAADEDQGKALLRELAEEGFDYVPFDPAHSQATWAIIDGKLVGGFDSVKGVGPKTAAELMAKREAGGAEWMATLTESQRDKLMRADNTPWHQLTYFQRTYQALYDNPEEYITPTTPRGVTRPVFLIKDIPSARGKYRFLGRVVRRMIKDKNSPEQVAKRNGEKLNSNSKFCNIIFADDTGEIGTTINRFKMDQFQWLTEGSYEGKDYLIRGDIIRDDGGMRWLFIDTVIEITPLTGAIDNGETGTTEAANGRANPGSASSSAGDGDGDGQDVRKAGGRKSSDSKRPAKRDVQRSRRAKGKLLEHDRGNGSTGERSRVQRGKDEEGGGARARVRRPARSSKR